MPLTEYLSLLQAVPEGSEEKQDSMLNLSPKGSSHQTGVHLPIKVLTKSGYQEASPGDSIDISYPGINSRRGRVGKNVAHTLTCSPTQAVFIDLNPDPKLTAHARCITARQDQVDQIKTACPVCTLQHFRSKAIQSFTARKGSTSRNH